MAYASPKTFRPAPVAPVADDAAREIPITVAWAEAQRRAMIAAGWIRP